MGQVRMGLPAIAFLLACSGMAVAQKGTVGANAPSAPAPPGLMIPRGEAAHDDDLHDPRLDHHIQELRKIERKRRMVDSANRLLVLTKQLQADLQGRAPTPEDQKRLDEIAKLARSVKDQMRN